MSEEENSPDIALRVAGLEKRFRRTHALRDLSFSIPKGVTCAFVGANGAGKTTTFSIVGGFLRPTQGELWIEGKKVKSLSRTDGSVGVLPQDMRFFEERTLENQLALFAKLTGFRGHAVSEEVTRVLAAVGLLEKRGEAARTLSRGMRVRLGVAQALIGSPPLILLDEPMAGLDPVVRLQVKELIQELHGNTTVMVSSHELGELQTFCDYIVAIDKGHCLFAGPMEEALGTGDEYITYSLATCPEDISGLEKRLEPRVVRLERMKDGVAKLFVQFGQESPSSVNGLVLSWLLEKEVPILEVIHRKSLEEAFLTFVRTTESPVT